MSENKKWKFFHNGDCWWLRITDPEQLALYCDLTDGGRFGESMMQVVEHRMNGVEGHYSGIAGEIDTLSRTLGTNLLETTHRMVSDEHYTYFKTLNDFGFVNINRNGGCNGRDWKTEIVKTADNLIFPVTSIKDITIKTWEMEDKKRYIHRPSNYKYHWYAYIGDVQIKDGEKQKWDTREECEEFVRKYFGGVCCE